MVLWTNWVRDGRMARGQAVKRLRKHLVDATVMRDTEAVSCIVAELVGYAPREALKEIEDAFRWGLVDEGIISWNCVQRRIVEGAARVDKQLACLRPTGIEDTVDELSCWAAFQPSSKPRPRHR